MKRSIGVDFDDVLVRSAELALAHYNSTYSGDITPDAFYTTDPLLWGTTDIDDAVHKINAYFASDEFIGADPFDDAIEIVQALSQENDMHVITGRPDTLAEATRAVLARHFPGVFQSVVFTGYGPGARRKAAVCQRLGVSVLIEDFLPNALDTAQSSIDVLLFGNYPWNQADTLPPNIWRARNWREIGGLLLPGHTTAG